MSGGSWKVAYADFTTAMMAFFLLMWLLNVASPEQKAGIAGYFQADATASSNNASPVTIANNPLVQYVDKLDTRQFQLNEVEESHYAIAQAIKKYLLQDAQLSPSSGLTSDGVGVLLHVNNNVMFKPGAIEFSDAGKRTLGEVVSIMSKYKVYLVVRGHADSAETGAPYPSKWELSAARSNAAVRYLIEHGVDAKLMRSIAYADTRPLQPSSIPGAAEANSRVEFNFHRPEVMSTVVGY